MARAVHELIEEERANPGRGRPTDYRPQYAVLARKLCLLNVGITDKDLADFFEVHLDTIQDWKLSQPDFLESIRHGKHISDLEVADALYRRATGATYVEEEVQKRKVVEYGENGKKSREEEFIEVVALVKQAPPDQHAARYWLNNRRRSEKVDRQWVDKVELTHNGGETPIKTEEVGMGFARRVAFMMEKSAREAAMKVVSPEEVTDKTAEPVTK